MQEKKNIAFGGARADIHLPTAPGSARRDQRYARPFPDNLAGSIIAAAVNHQAFNVLTQVADAEQRLPDACRFVQGGNNDANQRC